MKTADLRPHAASTHRSPVSVLGRARRLRLARVGDAVRMAALLAAATSATACVVRPEGDDDSTDTDDPTGGPAGEGCFDEPVADAGFSLELEEGWNPMPEGLDFYDLALDCTVATVEAQESEVVTALECDDAGTPRTATLRIAASPDGAPSWGPGSAVALAYFHHEDTELGTGLYRSLSLRQADDDALLVAAIDGDAVSSGDWLGSTPGTSLAPIVATEDREHCGWGGQEEALPMRITLSLDGASLDLVHGQRGTLPIAGETDLIAADLAEATVGHCCHYNTWFRLLVRRVS